MTRSSKGILLLVVMLGVGFAALSPQELAARATLPAGTEILEMRDAYSRHYSNGDGTIKAVIAPDPINQLDEFGNWQALTEVDLTREATEVPLNAADQRALAERAPRPDLAPPPGEAETDDVGNFYPNSASYNTGSVQQSGFYSSTYIYARGGAINTEYRGWARFNTTAIPDGSTVSDVVLHAYCYSSIGGPFSYLRHMQYDPAASPYTTVFNDIGDGTIYYSVYGVPTGWLNYDLGTTADATLQGQLNVNWFAVGFEEWESSTSYYYSCYGWDNGTYRPYVTVTYTPTGSSPDLTGVSPEFSERLQGRNVSAS